MNIPLSLLIYNPIEAYALVLLCDIITGNRTRICVRLILYLYIFGAANISQFINVYQATKGATSSQLNTELIKQNQHIENKLDEQTNMLLEKLLSELKIIEEQNIEIIKLLGGSVK